MNHLVIRGEGCYHIQQELERRPICIEDIDKNSHFSERLGSPCAAEQLSDLLCAARTVQALKGIGCDHHLIRGVSCFDILRELQRLSCTDDFEENRHFSKRLGRPSAAKLLCGLYELRAV